MAQFKLSKFETRLMSRASDRLNKKIARLKKQSSDLPKALQDIVGKYGTKSGYIKKGEKAFEKFTKQEYDEFQATYNRVNSIVNNYRLFNDSKITISNSKDLWKAVDYARELGTPPDSGSVHELVERYATDSDESVLAQAFSSIVDVGQGNIGLADFDERVEGWL